MDEIEIYINEDGTLQFIYSDTVACMLKPDATLRIVRASHVEPVGQLWTADLAPVGGPILGPFVRRQDALDAEVKWLRRRMAQNRLEAQ